MGIWGYGKIGQLVAGYAKAFGMQVVVWGSQASREKAANDGHIPATTREALFEQSDVLSVHLRLNEATRGIVTLEDLSRMKTTAMIVNTSRAELIEPDALISALNRGRPGLAAIDVIESKKLLNKVKQQGNYLIQELALIPGIKEVRGAGLLIGIELESLKASEIATAMRDAGVLVNAANATTIRIAPALVVTDAQINKFISIFKKVISDAK